MALDSKILTITLPQIAIDEMSIQDFDDPNSAVNVGTVGEQRGRVPGGIFPLVQINDKHFTQNEIMSLRLDETGFLPTISVSVAMLDGMFISNHFPKDGDVMSVFIRSKLDEFNPIRADF